MSFESEMPRRDFLAAVAATIAINSGASQPGTQSKQEMYGQIGKIIAV